MIPCPSCQTSISEGGESCPRCGHLFSNGSGHASETDQAPTLSPYEDSDPAPIESTAQLSDTLPITAQSVGEPRFVAGKILLDRYRIVSMIGRGAMGEIYRADDMRLGESVALKFLPESVANDGAMLARLYREVRFAHQISHPNVCRVYDISEDNGHHFLSMEYIDGENLASLLRRIGHPPQAKALQIAQQLCLGLAAAHGQGVLHRDIKPANVMIDGRGQAKITDFGLAGLVEDLGRRECRAGTPAYMAPEQLHGLEVSLRSDVYSLGLVLFELFTGRKAFLKNQRGTPPRPSTIVETLDLGIEKVILDCLKMDPAERPASMREVAGAMPGGDPLAAALAAGEIPSPEMVASSRREGSLRPPVALACVAFLLLELVVLALLCDKALLHRRVPFDKPPEVLTERARGLARELGVGAPGDEAYGFEAEPHTARFFAERTASRERWQALESGRPSFLSFWYRSSPLPMPPIAAGYWRVSRADPPMTQPGMARVTLDPDGRLLSFRRVLPRLELKPAPAGADWSLLFRAAELDPSLFRSTSLKHLAPTASDERWAWVGPHPNHPEFQLHVEAASYHGRPVYFRIFAPWTSPEPAWTRPLPAPTEVTRGELAAFQYLLMGLILTVLTAGAVLARRNLRGGRGDRRGAARLAAALFVIPMVSWIFWASHVPTFAELMLFMQAVGMALFRISFLWIVYMALEPFVRQSWPERIVSWSRFLSGRFRDPLVGRDLLLGALLGLGLLLVQVLGAWVPTLFGQPVEPLDLNVMDTDSLMGLAGVLRQLSEHIFIGPLFGLNFMFLLLLMTMILGRETWAAGACWLLLTLALNLGFAGGPSARLAMALGAALMVFGLQRFGLFTVATATVFYMTFRFFPVTADTGAWYFDSMLLALIAAVGPAIYGAYLTTAGQSFWRDLEDRVSNSSSL